MKLSLSTQCLTVMAVGSSAAAEAADVLAGAGGEGVEVGLGGGGGGGKGDGAASRGRCSSPSLQGLQDLVLSQRKTAPGGGFFAYFGDRIVYPGVTTPAQLPAVNGERDRSRDSGLHRSAARLRHPRHHPVMSVARGLVGYTRPASSRDGRPGQRPVRTGRGDAPLGFTAGGSGEDGPEVAKTIANAKKALCWTTQVPWRYTLLMPDWMGDD